MGKQPWDADIRVKPAALQQHLTRFSIAVVVLTAPTNRLSDLRPIVPALLEALPLVKKGEVREIGA